MASIKRSAASFVRNVHKSQANIIKTIAISLLLSVPLYKLSLYGSISCLKSSKAQNMAVQAALYCPRAITAPNSKVVAEVIEDSRECSAPQSEETSDSLVENLSTEVRNVENLSLVVSLNKTTPTPVKENSKTLNSQIRDLLRVKDLHVINKKLNRFFYIGTRAVETDPYQLELQNPWGIHSPTTVQIGHFKHTFRIPRIPRTAILKSNNIALAILEHKITASSPIKTFVTSLLKNSTIGPFFTSRITCQGNDLRSQALYLKTYMHQWHHLLMIEQIQSVHDNLNLQQMFVIFFHLLHPNQQIPPLPVLNQDGINHIRSMVREFFVPRYQAGDIPGIITVDNRVLVRDHQIKSTSCGILFEFNALRPTFVILKQENLWTKYIQRRLDITLRRTQTRMMVTNIIEARVNVGNVGCDVLRAVISRIPLVKQASPVVNALTLFGQDFFALQIHCQAGFQHSNSINFNSEQELQRTAQMARYNFRIAEHRLHHQITLFPPMNRTNYANHMQPVNSRTFYDMKLLFTIDFDLLGKLVQITSPKET